MNGYKEIRGTLIKKRRNVFGKYVFIMEESGVKQKINVGKMIFERTEVGTKWTIGHINGMLINIRPGICENTDE
ncbi:MAG: hypothetical protein IKW24_05000 [Clostridia bacterium]|nr:hypothetical protein [Clostridia bacterium]